MHALVPIGIEFPLKTIIIMTNNNDNDNYDNDKRLFCSYIYMYVFPLSIDADIQVTFVIFIAYVIYSAFIVNRKRNRLIPPVRATLFCFVN